MDKYVPTGKEFICVFAKTTFYKVGKTYPLVKAPDGELGFIGEDGLFDSRKKVQSKFQERKEDNVRQPTPLLPVH